MEDVTIEGMQSGLKDTGACYLCGSSDYSLMDYFRKKDSIGLISLNDWYVVDFRLDTSEEGYGGSTFGNTGEVEVYGDTVIDKGTDGGGAVEVYSSVEDANTRNDYLASFDGAGFLASGSHSVVGTVVIRTSDNLTATQQKEMEANIYNSLVELR